MATPKDPGKPTPTPPGGPGTGAQLNVPAALADALRQIEEERKRILHLVGPTGTYPNPPMLAPRDIEVFKRTRALEEHIESLRKKIEAGTVALQQEKATSVEKDKKIGALTELVEELQNKERLRVLLNSVDESVHGVLLESEELQQKFLRPGPCEAFVFAVDIRRSTELMLKARSPGQFADFVTTICADLMSIVKKYYGVFDKFTGDGILAFFPLFYSGEDAGNLAASAAAACHEAFETRYREHRSSFASILTDVGLCIGIDYGTSHLVQVAGGLTVVGVPVVYASRLTSGPASTTLMNQPAYEQLSARSGNRWFFSETQIEVKHEGPILAYVIRRTAEKAEVTPPKWLTVRPEAPPGGGAGTAR